MSNRQYITIERLGRDAYDAVIWHDGRVVDRAEFPSRREAEMFARRLQRAGHRYMAPAAGGSGRNDREHEWRAIATERWHDGTASQTTFERCEHCGLEIATSIHLPVLRSFMEMAGGWLSEYRDEVVRLRQERSVVRGDANDTVDLAADLCPGAPISQQQPRRGPHWGHWERQDYHEERAFEGELEDILERAEGAV